jgi:hypothetical protein
MNALRRIRDLPRWQGQLIAGRLPGNREFDFAAMASPERWGLAGALYPAGRLPLSPPDRRLAGKPAARGCVFGCRERAPRAHGRF